MPTEFFSLGECLPSGAIDQLLSKRAQSVLRALFGNRDFEVVELRELRIETERAFDIIVVDCLCDGVPSRNAIGIRNRERIALVFDVDDSAAPYTRTLRKDFPLTLHQDQGIADEPATLCLYFEPWDAVVRTWTPERHLTRLTWWLTETSQGTLHRGDQPPEQLYFPSPHTLVLPADIDRLRSDRSLQLYLRMVESPPGAERLFLVGHLASKGSRMPNGLHIVPILLTTEPVVHRSVEHQPNVLGDLAEQLHTRGIDLVRLLCLGIPAALPTDGLVKGAKNHVVILLQVPIKRSVDAPIERIDSQAFYIDHDIAAVGSALGIIHERDNRYFAGTLLDPAKTSLDAKLAAVTLSPLQVKYRASTRFARKSAGISDSEGEFKGVVCGVGALGSTLIDMWTRSGWGNWTCVDPDYVMPHNIVRHIAKDSQVGETKVSAVRSLVQRNLSPDQVHLDAIHCSASDQTNANLLTAFSSADLIVDASTTLNVPRDLSSKDDIRRAVSVFISPSGKDGVLLAEDSGRKLRLDALEAQYYRAIIRNRWGEEHLRGHRGTLWVGAGCRDISAVIPTDLIQLHAGNLSQRLRQVRQRDHARIIIYSYDVTNGGISVHNVDAEPIRERKADEWRIVIDEGVHRSMREIRTAGLPKETGGVLVGFTDQVSKSIFVVDALPPPPDSEATETGFIRGKEGLSGTIDDITARTGGIVGYIGEWHSHPRHASSRPSPDDFLLLRHMTLALAHDGVPALMIIVSDTDYTGLLAHVGAYA